MWVVYLINRFYNFLIFYKAPALSAAAASSFLNLK